MNRKQVLTLSAIVGSANLAVIGFTDLVKGNDTYLSRIYRPLVYIQGQKHLFDYGKPWQDVLRLHQEFYLNGFKEKR